MDNCVPLVPPAVFLTPGEHHLRCLDPSDDEYRDISHLFAKNWSHPKTVKIRPKICAIFEIRLEINSLFAYHSQKCQIQASCSSLQALHPARSTGNETLLFHGTDRLCAIGEQRKNIIPCSSQSCRLCRIIQGSFDLSKCQSKHNFSRFGQGIYTTSCSSKADDYVSNLSEKLRFKAMLANRVLVGRSISLTRTNVSITNPPAGYHSIEGKPGKDLNYPETVVYDNNSIRPAFLIIYNDDDQPYDSNFRSKITKLFRTPLAS